MLFCQHRERGDFEVAGMEMTSLKTEPSSNVQRASTPD